MFKLFIAAVVCFAGQKLYAQSRCTVYQYPAGNASERKVVLRQYKDGQGHVLREEVSGYNNFLDNTSTMYCHREDGVYEYYYDDAEHYKTVVTKYDERTGKPIDSDKVFYYYDNLNARLTRELTVRHLNKRAPGRKPGGFRNGCDIIYDNNNRVVRKRCDESDEYLSYDPDGRLAIDSVVYSGEIFNIVTRFVYESNAYKAIEWASDKRCPVVKCVTLGEAGKVVSEAVCAFSGNAGLVGRANERRWAAVMTAGSDRLKEEERTEYLYDSKGRLRETHYYFGGRHTTTHEYLYENAGLSEKRIRK
ncbi:MAG: hypothetical protein JNM41_16240 [Flavipsychrobacter sp.]|nr:hypothetical protein [Flavipsychrobacter sp.]